MASSSISFDTFWLMSGNRFVVSCMRVFSRAGGPSLFMPPMAAPPGITEEPWVPTGPPECSCEDSGSMGKGEGEGPPMRRDGEPGAETRGPREPGKLKAELLGGPRLELRFIEARLEFRFVRLSTCFVENN